MRRPTRTLPLLLVLPLLAACSSERPPRERAGKGGRFYGGVFNINETENLRSLFPLSITQAASQRVAAQVYEGLLALDQGDLSLVPALAESWTVDDTGLEYTFRIRDNVRFHDDPCFPGGKGRALTADDVVHCFTALCTSEPKNQMFWLFQDKVMGANEHYALTARGSASAGVAGISAPDDRTVRIRLTAPWRGFLQALAHQGCWVYPKELPAYYGEDVRWHMVGTGPFRVKNHRRGEVLVLERNDAYWGVDEYGNALPFLDAVRITFQGDKAREFDQFEKGRLSLVYELPEDRADRLEDLAKGPYTVQTVAGMATQFYGFNSRMAPFNDVRVRGAFSLAIDRRALVDSVLRGLGIPASRGIVPPGMQGYPYDSVPELRFDPQAARALLAEAGYGEGKPLPTVYLQVNSDGFGYLPVASQVQSMLERHIGARVVISVLPLDQHYDRIEHAKAMLWREGWVADHPDPENFLALFHGRSVPADSTAPSTLNSTRFKDAVYDTLFAHAQRSTVEEERLLSLARAERRAMEQYVVAPLYHERSVRLLQHHVRNLPINGMEHRILRAVWFDPSARTR
jgi:peptide/nickel transport system substrate-binding protein